MMRDAFASTFYSALFMLKNLTTTVVNAHLTANCINLIPTASTELQFVATAAVVILEQLMNGLSFPTLTLLIAMAPLD